MNAPSGRTCGHTPIPALSPSRGKGSRWLATLLAATSLAACTVGPNYVAPQVAVPSTFAEKGTAATDANAELATWWAQLGDPVLDSLMKRALDQNLDVKTAAARVREARTQVIIARTAGLPSLSGSAVAITRRAPFDDNASSSSSGNGSSTSGGSANQSFAIPSHLDVYSLGADATWQLDLFGGVRRGVEAAKAEEAAANWQARDAQVALSAEVARAYLSLRVAQARRATAQADIDRLNDLLGLVRSRAEKGIVSNLDVNQQRQLLQTRQQELPGFDKDERTSLHALGVLLAQDPNALEAELIPAKPMPATPVTLPVGLPSDLLKRRPDIRTAERQLAAATAQIGVAQADLYPKIDLLGLASFAGTDLGSLLSKRNFSVIGAGDGSWSFFNGGKTRATIEQRKVQAEEADLAYRSAILSALKDVEDALVSYRSDTAQADLVNQSLATARDTETLSQNQYTAGITAYLDVLQAQQAVRMAEDQQVSAQAARLADLVSLYTALGGGWSDPKA